MVEFWKTIGLLFLIISDSLIVSHLSTIRALACEQARWEEGPRELARRLFVLLIEVSLHR